MAYSIEQENPQLHERIKAILSPTQELLRQTSSSPIRINECINIAYDACVKIATEQRQIDIETIPQLYIRWLMIDDEHGFEKPSWKEYANKFIK